ncbi:filament-like plant protein 4 [Tanacetum coccineum]
MSQNASGSPSVASFSEEGNDDEVSVAGSWATTMISELSHNKKDKSNESPQRTENANSLELMDDFLELEKLAYSSNDSPKTKSCSDTSGITNNDQVAVGTNVEKPESDYSKKPNGDEDLLPLANLKSKVSDLLNSLPKDTDSEKLYEEISRAVQSSNNLESAGGKDEELTTVISRIYDFVSNLGKEETCYVLQY